MAQSDLNYHIAVKLDQLKELQLLHDTIVAIQNVSRDGAEFNVRINATSLQKLTADVRNAVRAGMAGGGGGGGGGGQPRSSGAPAATPATSAPAAPTRAQAPAPAAPAQPVANPAPARPAKLEEYIKKNQELLKTVDDIVNKRIKLTEQAMEQVAARMGKRFQQRFQELTAALRSMEDGGEYAAKADEIRSEMFSGERLRTEVQQRLNRARGARPVSPRSYTPTGGDLSLAVDVAALNRAFTDGAAVLARGIQSGIENSLSKIVPMLEAAVAAANGGGGGGADPSKAVPKALDTFRNTSGQAERQAVLEARRKWETELTSIAQRRQKAQQDLDRVESDRMRLAQEVAEKERLLEQESNRVEQIQGRKRPLTQEERGVAKRYARAESLVAQEAELRRRYEQEVAEASAAAERGPKAARIRVALEERIRAMGKVEPETAAEDRLKAMQRRVRSMETIEAEARAAMVRPEATKQRLDQIVAQNPSETVAQLKPEINRLMRESFTREERKLITALTEAETTIAKDRLKLEELTRRSASLRAGISRAETEETVRIDSIRQAGTTLEYLGTQGAPIWSQRQAAQAMVDLTSNPQGLAAAWTMRGLRTWRGLSEEDAAFMQEAAGSRIMAAPEMFGGLSAAAQRDPAAQGLVKEIKRLEEDRDKLFASVDAETDPVRKAAGQTTLDAIQEKIQAAMLERDRVMFEAVNRLIRTGSTTAQLQLARQVERGEITGADYRGRLGSLKRSEMSLEMFEAAAPDLRKDFLLIPEEIARYIRGTLKKYADALNNFNQAPLDPALVEDISGSALMSTLAGPIPKTADDAAKAYKRVRDTMRTFDDYTAAYDQAKVASQFLRLPNVAPDLDNPYSAELPERFQSYRGNEGRPAPDLTREQRQAIRDRFFKAGGDFVPFTQERKDYVEKELEALNTWLREKGELSEGDGWRRFELEQELGFGGRYFMPGAEPKVWTGGGDGEARENRRRGYEHSRLTEELRNTNMSGPQISEFFERANTQGVRAVDLAVKEGLLTAEKAKFWFDKSEADLGGGGGGALVRQSAVHRGALLAPSELERVLQGGVASPIVENPFTAARRQAEAERATTPEAKAAQELTVQIREADKALERISKTLSDIGKANVDPLVEQFEKLTRVLGPYAQTLDTISKTLSKFGGLQATALKVAEAKEIAQVREDAKTEGYGDRQTIYKKGSRQRIAERRARARAEADERIRVLEAQVEQKVASAEQMRELETLLERSLQTERSAGYRQRQDIKAEGAPARLQEQAARERLRTESLLARRMLLQNAKSVDLPTLSGDPNAPSYIQTISDDDKVLQQQLIAGRRNLARQQMAIQQSLALYSATMGAQMPTGTAERGIANATVKYDAFMGTYATNAQEMAMVNPRFFKGASQSVIASSQRVLETQNRRAELGNYMRMIAQGLDALREIAPRIAALKNDTSEGGQRLRGQLIQRRDELRGVISGGYQELQNRGFVGAGDPRTLNTLAASYGKINAELGKYYDGLVRVTQASVDLAAKGGGFPDRLMNKLRNLSAYVTAGGIVYTIASQLRTAATEAVNLEADIRRIQGVLDSRSGGQAAAIGRGIVGTAQDYGVPLTQAVQAGKLFAQTGATPDKVIELTQASLAAQVGAGLDASQATELLVAVESITNKQVKSFDILDRISRIEAQYAVSASDLSNAIQRAGSLALQLQPQALGAVDALDLIIGASTTIVERTRVSGEQAATALRFIISRLGAPEVARALQQQFGIKLAGDDPRTLRPLQDILGDIAKEYQRMQSSGETVRAQQLLATFAGARQANIGAALLSGIAAGDVDEVANKSAYAFGDTQERLRLQLDTMQAKFAQFNTAFTGFMSDLLGDSGIAWGLKRLLEIAASGLQLGTTGSGSFALGAALSGVAIGARGGRTALNRLGQRPAAQQLVEGLETTAFGAAMPVATTLSASAGLAGGAVRTGAGALGVLGRVASPLAIFFSIYSVIEGISALLKRRADQKDVVTGADIDRKLMREMPFYRGYEELARGYGSNPDDLYKAAAAVATRVQTDVDEAIAKGKIPETSRYNESIRRVVEEFDNIIPGFALIGDEAKRAGIALSVLRESAKFGLIIPQTVTNELRKDVDNAFTKYNEQSADIGKLLREEAAGAIGLNATGFTGALIGANGFPLLTSPQALGIPPGGSEPEQDVTMSSLNRLFKVGNKQLLDFSKVAFRGMTGEMVPIRTLVSQLMGANQEQYAGKDNRQLRALDQYAKDNLLLSTDGENEGVSRLFTAAEKIRRDRNLSSTAVISAEERLRVALDGMTKATDEQKDAVREVSRKLVNQEVVAEQLATQLGTSMNLKPRLDAARAEGKVTSDTPGELLAASIRQIVVRARESLLKQFDMDAKNTQPQAKALMEFLNRLEKSTGRLSQEAITMAIRAQIKDQVFSPFISYLQRTGEIRTQTQLGERFGIAFDPLQARADNALQLMSGVANIRTRLTTEQLREAASVLATGGLESVIKNLTMPEADESGAAGGLKRNVIGDVEGAVLGSVATRRQEALARIEQYATQLAALDKEGLGEWLEQLGSVSPEMKKAATAFDTAFTAFKKLNDESDKTPEKLLEILKSGQSLEDIVQQIQEALEGDVDPSIQRQRNLGRIRRTGDLQQADMQLQLNARLAMSQMDIARMQLDPQRIQQAFDLQQQQIEAQYAGSMDAARTRFETQQAALAEQYKGAEFQTAYKEALAEAENVRNTAEMQARGTRSVGLYNLASGANTNAMARQRQEATQLAEGMTGPLKEFLSSYKNFSKEGVRTLVEGVARAAQQRLVDMFVKGSGLEQALVSAFNKGSLSTQNAIERGFTNSLPALEATLRAGLSGGGVHGTSSNSIVASAITGMPSASSVGINSVEDYVATYMPDARLSDLSDDQRASIEQWIAAGGAATAAGGALTAAGAASSKLTPEQRAVIANANTIGSPQMNWKGAVESALPMIGSLAGANIRGNADTSYSSEGASMGALLGNMVVPGIGGLVGGLLGGVLGGAFGKDQPEPERQFSALQQIERNTRQQIEAIENQTRMLTLDNRFMNVPTGFTTPGFRPFGVTGGSTANITVNVDASGGGADAQSIGDAVASAIASQLRGLGTSFDVRYA